LAFKNIKDCLSFTHTNSVSKAGDILFARRQLAGKRLCDDPGEWWLRGKALSSYRREPWPWPGRVRTSGVSSSCEEEIELQN
jgi:hypothetical protein